MLYASSLFYISLRQWFFVVMANKNIFCSHDGFFVCYENIISVFIYIFSLFRVVEGHLLIISDYNVSHFFLLLNVLHVEITILSFLCYSSSQNCCVASFLFFDC